MSRKHYILTAIIMLLIVYFASEQLDWYSFRVPFTDDESKRQSIRPVASNNTIKTVKNNVATRSKNNHVKERKKYAEETYDKLKDIKGSNFYEQFKMSRYKSPLKELIKLKGRRIHYKKANSKYEVEDLSIRYKDPEEKDGIISIQIDIAASDDTAVQGCNFEATQIFNADRKRISVCSSTDHFNGSYEIQCSKPIVNCCTIKVTLDYCFFEAFSDEPRYRPWELDVFKESYCIGNSDAQTNDAGPAVSWSIKKRKNKFVPDKIEKCDELYLSGSPVTLLTEAEMCGCLERFDDIYMVGTSHLGHFSDYLMIKCNGENMTHIVPGMKHGNYDSDNLHFRVGRYSHDVHSEIHANLTTWSKPGSKIAIWILTGSWDNSASGLQYAIEIGNDYYVKESLIHIQNHLSMCRRCHIDVRVISTPPMPRRHHVNFYQVQSYMSRAKQLAEEIGVKFYDMFTILLPCYEDTAQNGKMRHHYLQRYNDTFDGHVGKTFFQGVFIPDVCTQ